MIEESYGTIWVCGCCMYSHANVECCEGNNDDSHKQKRDEKGRFMSGTVLDDGFPLSKIRPPYSVSLGMGRDEHECDDPDDDCECEKINFSHSQCEGCGSYLYGERHAMTLWGPAAV